MLFVVPWLQRRLPFGSNLATKVPGCPGFSVGPKERKHGIKGSPTREIYFENCVIPADRIIGEPGTGLKTALRILDHTRPTIGEQAVGIAQGALDAAIAYVKERKQFGKHLAEFQGLQFMLADMAMKVEAARQLCYVAVSRAERIWSTAPLTPLAILAGSLRKAATSAAVRVRMPVWRRRL